MSKELDYLGEGPTDDAIARRMIESLGAIPGKTRRTPLSGSGKSNLDKRLKGLNAGLYHGGQAMLVLRDLDDDAACPSALVSRLIPTRHTNMLLRICVKESEAWILADAEVYSKYCGISISRIPADTDNLDKAKQTILSWIDRSMASKLARYIQESRKRGVPDWAALAGWNLTYIEERWNPMRAYQTGRSKSLRRAVDRLKMFIEL